MTITQEQLNDMIIRHRRWWASVYEGSSRLVLGGEDLSGLAFGEADLRGAILRECNLTGASFRGTVLAGCQLINSDLTGVELWGTVGNGLEVISLQTSRWNVAYTHDRMSIGCQSHSLAEWWGFDDLKIGTMANGAVEWWAVWKPIIQGLVKTNPARGFK